MCTRYVTPAQQDIERHWSLGADRPWRADTLLFPRGEGPIVRAAPGAPARELVVARWGLIPHFARSADLPYATVNARSEEMAAKASYRGPWARGQRCLIPAAAFDEPCWETGRNVWWRFRRADGAPWALAGLWSRWTDPDSGEAIDSYTMLTLNADAHPLMSRMHKPDPRLAPDAQDKRSVVALEPADWDTWLHGSPAEARTLIRLTPAEAFIGRPAGPDAERAPAAGAARSARTVAHGAHGTDTARRSDRTIAADTHTGTDTATVTDATAPSAPTPPAQRGLWD